MKKVLKIILLLGLFSVPLHSQELWQKLSDPPVSEVIGNFQNPPAEYGPNLLWGWNGPVDEEVIKRDLDKIASLGFPAVSIEAGYKMNAPYLSGDWFKLIGFAVAQAKERGMKVWLIDEGKYPSGFAGGKFSSERPDLKMQGLEVAERLNVSGGERVYRELSGGIISAVAVNSVNETSKIIDISSGSLDWTAPEGEWKILLARHRFRTSVTRAANNPTGGKDTLNSLCDYLNPEATRQFISFTHEEYKKYFGDEFGKTVLGFRGDEPDYGFIPWTPTIPGIFKDIKGYDILPYIASFYSPFPTKEMLKAKADYWDVWSGMFAENFFKIQADWCAKNNMEYIVHLNHEDKMMQLVRSGGDFFKNMDDVQIPGIDAIWNQVWPGTIADFPKLASSAAHTGGKPRAFSESFAAYRTRPTVSTGKWVIDQQFARGINLFEIMFFGSSAGGNTELRGWMASDSFPDLTRYTSRLSFLLSQGRPAARIAVYFPTASMWMGDKESDSICWSVTQQLLEHQLDFDFVSDRDIISGMELGQGSFINRSGQAYQSVIIPSASLIPLNTLERLHKFADSGGKVIVFDKKPSQVFSESIMNAEMPGNTDWMIYESSAIISEKVMNALPAKDALFAAPAPGIKYTHRKLKNGELYFLFNEGENTVQSDLSLTGKGKLQLLNPMDGSSKEIKTLENKPGYVSFPVEFKAWETKVFIFEK